jgi:hypothetical protein
MSEVVLQVPGSKSSSADLDSERLQLQILQQTEKQDQRKKHSTFLQWVQGSQDLWWDQEQCWCSLGAMAKVSRNELEFHWAQLEVGYCHQRN